MFGLWLLRSVGGPAQTEWQCARTGHTRRVASRGSFVLLDDTLSRGEQLRFELFKIQLGPRRFRPCLSASKICRGSRIYGDDYEL